MDEDEEREEKVVKTTASERLDWYLDSVAIVELFVSGYGHRFRFYIRVLMLRWECINCYLSSIIKYYIEHSHLGKDRFMSILVMNV